MTSTIEKQIEAFSAGSASEYAFPSELTADERKMVKTTAEKFDLSTKSFGMGGERQIHIFKRATSTTPEFEAVKYSVKNTFVDGPVDSTESQGALVGPAHQSMPVGCLQAHIEAEAEEMATPSNLLEKLNTMVSKAEESPRNSQSGGSTADSESGHCESEAAQDPPIPIKNSFVHFEGDDNENGDPRIIQSMPNGKFAESIEAEKAVASKAPKQKGRPLPFSEDPEPEAERVSAMVFPSTPNAETSSCTVQACDHGQAVPGAHWVSPTTAPQDSSVTILPPACWAPSAPSQTVLDSSKASPESSITILPPACWTQSAPVQNDASAVPQGPPQGFSQGPPPLMPPLGPSSPSCFMPGTPVVICGLASQPTFNGLRGTVSSFDAECSRYNIMVETGPNAARRMVKVKFQNLLLAQPMVPPQPPVLPPQIPPPAYYPSSSQAGYSYAPQACPQGPPPPKPTLTLDAMI